MYNVLFQGLGGEKRSIGIATTEALAYRIINEFLDEKKYKSYYTRSWQVDDDTIQVDVGSWSEFFFIVKAD